MSHTVPAETPNTSSNAAFWACAIFVGLLIGAINFTKPSGDHNGGHATEQGHEGHAPATSDHHHPAEEAHPAH